MKVLAISSSFSRASKSHRILNITQHMHLPKDVIVEAADINLALFSSATKSHHSDAVAKFRHQLNESKAVLFVASEQPNGFPYSVTAALLNAVNWGSHGSNLFKGKSAAFASVDSYNPHNFGGAWDTSLHSPNLYHLRQLASVVGLNCLHSKFDLHPGKHYSTDSEELDDAQTVQVTNTMVNLVHDLVYFHRFEKKKRKHNIPKHFHFMA